VPLDGLLDVRNRRQVQLGVPTDQSFEVGLERCDLGIRKFDHPTQLPPENVSKHV
jgi:hypothetical protein